MSMISIMSTNEIVALMGLFITILSTLVVALGWLFRLDGRVSQVDQKHESLRELINVRFDSLSSSLTSRFDSIDGRFNRIERNINGKDSH